MKKVLVISFDCFNSSSSNGRSLGSLLKLSDELSISQIFIKNGVPNFIDGNYCFINENLLPKKFFNINRCTRFFSFSNDEQNSETSKLNAVNNPPKIRKTPFKMFCRNIAWGLASFSLKPVFKWVDDIKPDFVLVQAGDLPFLFYLSKKIAKRCQSKLVFYSTENYPFKKRNYTNLRKKSLFYSLLRRKLYNATKCVVESADSSIFLTESLRQEFSENYCINGETYVVYPCSEIKELPPKKKTNQRIFSYCGKLDLGRDETLISVAKILQTQYPHCKMIVCGSCSDSTIDKFKNIDIVDYIGVIPYKDVIGVYEKSDYILHVESFDELIAADSKHAFSGKIADCISTCRPFIFVGPENIYEYQFLKKTKSALTFNSIESFRCEVSLGALDNHLFDIENQKAIKDEFFSKDKAKVVIEEVFQTCVE